MILLVGLAFKRLARSFLSTGSNWLQGNVKLVINSLHISEMQEVRTLSVFREFFIKIISTDWLRNSQGDCENQYENNKNNRKLSLTNNIIRKTVAAEKAWIVQWKLSPLKVIIFPITSVLRPECIHLYLASPYLGLHRFFNWYRFSSYGCSICISLSNKIATQNATTRENKYMY